MQPTDAQIRAIENFYTKAVGMFDARDYARQWRNKTRKEASAEIARLIELRGKGQWTGPLDLEEKHKADAKAEKLKIQQVFETLRKMEN